MDHRIPTWAAIVVAAKIFADLLYETYRLRRIHVLAAARPSNQVGAAYAAMLAASILVMYQIGPAAALPVAIVVRVVHIASWHPLLTANHSWLEFFVAVLMFRLFDRPAALASAIQVMSATVWIYAAFQKWYHGEFLDGTYFRLASRRCGPGGIARLKTILARLDGARARTDPRSDASCRRLAVLVVATELVTPAGALAMTGTVWSVVLMLLVSAPVGLVTQETNFLITNVILAMFFLVPFDLSQLWTIATDWVAAGIVVWFLVWPPAHAMLTKRLRLSTWKLAGWGMYATSFPRVQVIGPKGELLDVPTTRPSIPFGLVFVCGASESRWLRDYARRGFFRWCHTSPGAGLVFSWHRRRGDGFMTSHVVVWNAPGATSAAFDVTDENSSSELRNYVTHVAATLLGSPHDYRSQEHAASVGSPVGVR